MDCCRYYPVDIREANASDPDRGNDYYLHHVAALYKRCMRHESHGKSLYTGDLGTRCFLPYRLATSKSFCLDLIPSREQYGANDRKQVDQARWDILHEALKFADYVRKRQYTSSRAQRVSLLEGELVGALAMIIVISNAMLALADNLQVKAVIKSDMDGCKEELSRIGISDVHMSLPPSECDILYGRAGYLKAIAFVRREITDPLFGTDIALKLVGEIWNEGKRLSKQLSCSLPLIWEWHSSLYLGAAHGVTGVLHTLLDFEKELLQVDEGACELLERTATTLNDYCFESGNLASSIPKSRDFREKTDRLVQFCHGAPGHVLLLTQMYIKSGDVKYLNQAKQICQSVILPRGLLRKGVGLCHGISGNGYCFLSVHRVEFEYNDNTEMQSSVWLRYAQTYANFALDHLNELDDVPDRPYSLYEGIAGLVCFLLDLIDVRADGNVRFPCYET